LKNAIISFAKSVCPYVIIIIIISCTTASRRYYGSTAEVSANEEQVASLSPQREFLISLIQQPEPSGSEAGESRVRLNSKATYGFSLNITLRSVTKNCRHVLVLPNSCNTDTLHEDLRNSLHIYHGEKRVEKKKM
jgi:hypothetical protein